MASQSVVGTVGALPSHDYSTRQTERREGVKCMRALREKEVLQVLHNIAYQENTGITENIYFNIYSQ